MSIFQDQDSHRLSLVRAVHLTIMEIASTNLQKHKEGVPILVTLFDILKASEIPARIARGFARDYEWLPKHLDEIGDRASSRKIASAIKDLQDREGEGEWARRSSLFSS